MIHNVNVSGEIGIKCDMTSVPCSKATEDFLGQTGSAVRNLPWDFCRVCCELLSVLNLSTQLVSNLPPCRCVWGTGSPVGSGVPGVHFGKRCSTGWRVWAAQGGSERRSHDDTHESNEPQADRKAPLGLETTSHQACLPPAPLP